jgi:peptidoglycan/LPS O-acetylase OafA/YrhL
MLFVLYCHFAMLGPRPYPSFTEFFVTLHLNFLLAPACYVLFFGLAIGSSAVGKVLSARVPVYLGTISYSIYLGHAVALSFAYVGPDHPNKGLGVAACLALTIAMASGTYLLVEWPGRKLLRQALVRLVLRSRAVPAPGGAS